MTIFLQRDLEGGGVVIIFPNLSSWMKAIDMML